jgi:hypothetical protein
MRRWVILNGLLAVIVLGLGVQIVRTWARTLPPIEARAPAKVADAPERGAGGSKRGKRNQADKSPSTPVALVTAIVNKDLFDPSRTKATEETKVQSTIHIVDPPPGISLVGVRMFGKDREGFILDATQSNTQRRIRTGDTVGNFTVKSIRQSSVVLVSQTGDFVQLSLEVEKSKNPTATAIPPRPGRPQAAAAAAGAGSPAAGITGASPAAGIGGTPRPPAHPGGSPATSSIAVQPPQPGQPPATPPAPGRHGGAAPNLPEGVRQKLEQMKQLNRNK